jgi:hypothetical protein
MLQNIPSQANLTFRFLVGSLNTTSGMEFWRGKWYDLLDWIRRLFWKPASDDDSSFKSEGIYHDLLDLSHVLYLLTNSRTVEKSQKIPFPFGSQSEPKTFRYKITPQFNSINETLAKIKGWTQLAHGIGGFLARRLASSKSKAIEWRDCAGASRERR